MAEPVPALEHDRRDASRHLRVPTPVPVAVAAVAAVVALLGHVGGDALWLAALGEEIVRSRAVPEGVPYALADSQSWHNVPVAAQLAAHVLVAGFGPWGLLLAHVVAVGGGLLAIGRDAARAGATSSGIVISLTLLVTATGTTLLIARLQLFSLLLFPCLVALLRQESRQPSRMIWLVPLTLAAWSNLHGAVLVGFAMTVCYLTLHRMRQRPSESVAVLSLSALALMATPAGSDTLRYYLAVSGNEAARQHVGLWARLSPDSPFDQIFMVATVALIVMAIRSRPLLWEMVSAAGLLAGTISVARNGVWLAMFLSVPAARAVSRLPVGPLPLLRGITLVGTLLMLAATAGRDSVVVGASPQLVDVARLASTSCVLHADGVLGEQVVASGGKVWITNPLDAFHRDEQHRFLMWIQTGDPRWLPPQTDAVFVGANGTTDHGMRESSFRLAAHDGTASLYTRGTACRGLPILADAASAIPRD